MPTFDLVAISYAGNENVLVRRSAETGEVTDLGTPVSGGAFVHVDADGTILFLDGDGMYARHPDGAVEQLTDDDWGCASYTADGRFFGTRPIDDDTRVAGLFERDGTLVEEYWRGPFTALCIVPGDDYLAWWGEAPNRAHVDVWVTDLEGKNQRMIADGVHCNEIVFDSLGDLVVYSDACQFGGGYTESWTWLANVATGEQTVIAAGSGGAQFSPDGRYLAMGIPQEDGDTTDLWVVSVPDGRLLFTVPSASWPAWVPAAEE